MTKGKVRRMSVRKLDLNRIRYVLILLLGIALVIVSRLFIQERWAGVLVGLGAGLFGMSGAQLITQRVMQRNPGLQKKMSIEQSDERNVQINNYAKAKAFEFSTFIALPFFLILVFADVALPIVLLSIAVYVVDYAVYLWFLNKKMKSF